MIIRMMMLTTIIDFVTFLSDPNTIGIGPRNTTPPIFDFFVLESNVSLSKPV